jgi:hypothetical protein
MRQVYTSLRVETVEGVAKLLKDAGIDVYIANGRSYHSKRGGQFSYAEPMQPKQQPSLWVKRAEDQPRAREILREAGLIASSRQGQQPGPVFSTPAPEAPGKRPLAWKIRTALLVVIAIFAIGSVIRYRGAMPPPSVRVPAAAPADPAAPAKAMEEDIRIRIPNPTQPPPPPDQ